MGNQQPVTSSYPWDWITGPTGEGDYDNAGYLPPAMKYAPQRSWSEPDNYGGDAHMRGTITNNNLTFEWGLTEGLLTSFGTRGTAYGYPQLWDLSQGQPFNGGWADGEFVSVKAQPQPYSSWKPYTFKGDLDVCTPENFPNCSMLPMTASGGEASFFDHTTTNAARIYKDSVTRAYNNAFVSGGIEALDSVNSSEHSTFDPCSNPSLFELLLPLAAAATAALAYRTYGRPEIVLLANEQVADAGFVVVFGFVYNYSRGLLAYLREPTNYYFEQAARFLTYPIGAWAGNAAGNYAYAQSSQSANPTLYQYGGMAVGVLLAERVLVVPIAALLSQGGILAGLILGAFGWVLTAVSQLWCRLVTPIDSCNAFDVAGLEDSRRWDAVSIAAKLTLEVCEREGWQKDSAEAEFVFRGLLSGPGLMTAPVATSSSSDPPTIFDNTLANPLGYLYAGRWQQEFPIGTSAGDPSGTLFTRDAQVFGWDGDIGGFADNANANLYACENWDIMREGLQQKTHPATQILKNKFDAWIGNWKNPDSGVGVLVAAAKIPANLEKMKHIPGWELQDATNLVFPGLLRETTLQESPLTNLERTILPEWMFVSKPISTSYLTPTTPTQAYLQTNLPFFDSLPIGTTPVDTHECAALWQDILGAGPETGSLDAAGVHNYIVKVLAANYCAFCDVESRARLESLRLAVDLENCDTFVTFMQGDKPQTGPWTIEAIGDALYGLDMLLTCKNPQLVAWAQTFFHDTETCGSVKFVPGGFSTLSKTITDGWCANEA